MANICIIPGPSHETKLNVLLVSIYKITCHFKDVQKWEQGKKKIHPTRRIEDFVV